jgi:hypothetical protein
MTLLMSTVEEIEFNLTRFFNAGVLICPDFEEKSGKGFNGYARWG